MMPASILRGFHFVLSFLIWNLSGVQAVSITSCFVFFGPIGDLGYTWSHNRNRVAFHELLIERFPNVTARTVYHEFISSTTNPISAAGQVITAFVESEDCDVLYCQASQFATACTDVAAAYPKLWVSQFLATPQTSFPNLFQIDRAYYEATYIAGAVAAASSAVDDFCYVLPITPLFTEAVGFLSGARTVRPEARLHIVFLGQFLWPDGEARAAQELMNHSQCEVISYFTNTPSPLQTFLDAGRLGIGHNGDQSEFLGDHVLLSTGFDNSPLYLAFAEAVLRGLTPDTLPDGTASSFNLTAAMRGEKAVANPPLAPPYPAAEPLFQSMVESIRKSHVFVMTVANELNREFGVSPLVSSVPSRALALSTARAKLLENSTSCQAVFGPWADAAEKAGVSSTERSALWSTTNNWTHYREVCEHGTPDTLAVAAQRGQWTQRLAEIPGVTVYPVFQLPESCPNNTVGTYEAITLRCTPCLKGEVSSLGAACKACVPGTYSGDGECVPCADGFTSTSLSSVCVPCPGVDGFGCTETFEFPVFGIVIVVLIGIAIIAGGAWLGVRYYRSVMQFRNLYGAVALAEATAEAITTWNLDRVQFLRQLNQPDRLQIAFLRMINNLEEYRPYLPQHLISSRDDNEADEESGLLEVGLPPAGVRPGGSRARSGSVTTASASDMKRQQSRLSGVRPESRSSAKKSASSGSGAGSNADARTMRGLAAARATIIHVHYSIGSAALLDVIPRLLAPQGDAHASDVKRPLGTRPSAVMQLNPQGDRLSQLPSPRDSHRDSTYMEDVDDIATLARRSAEDATASRTARASRPESPVLPDAAPPALATSAPDGKTGPLNDACIGPFTVGQLDFGPRVEYPSRDAPNVSWEARVSALVETVSMVVRRLAPNALTSVGPDGTIYIALVAGRVSNREYRAVDVASALMDAAPDGLSLSVGIASGVDVCGSVGGGGLKAFVHIGHLMPTAMALAITAHAVGGRIALADRATVNALVGRQVVARAVVNVIARGQVINLEALELMPSPKATTEEWMYELRAAEVPAEIAQHVASIRKYVTGEVSAFEAATLGVPGVLIRPHCPPYDLSWFARAVAERQRLNFWFSADHVVPM
eukprot:TRINITY_DN67543_c0_g1_i1.p1 TRINITY_DN67543_c0_g1~~TRINITY_DN67543_c0_g1_i1.p1  ORF type:complete len:1107 (-),score=190.46 TRINITY_DN67543_c0_g1_i1:240-3560(-)